MPNIDYKITRIIDAGIEKHITYRVYEGEIATKKEPDHENPDQPAKNVRRYRRSSMIKEVTESVGRDVEVRGFLNSELKKESDRLGIQPIDAQKIL